MTQTIVQRVQLKTMKKVELSISGSSPDPLLSIYRHQHVCVAETVNWTTDTSPSREKMANAIIREMKQGHWSVLRAGFAKLEFSGFNHATAMQFRTHQDLGHLTQSLRYTGTRFRHAMSYRELEQTFHVKTEHDYDHYQRCVDFYLKQIKDGMNKEEARNYLPIGFIQGWSSGGDIQAWMHMLDQRLLMDTQTDARVAAAMCLDQLVDWCPELFTWYRDNRAGKNKLAP